jgi:hypothetical protein
MWINQKGAIQMHKKITGGLVAALVLTSLVCSDSFAAKKQPAKAPKGDVTTALANLSPKAQATLSKLDARTINALSKMDPRAIDALSKMDAKAIDAVGRMGTSGDLATMRKNPKTVDAYKTMSTNMEAKKK